jgi:cyclic 2,3-diphosphoglycerate synthetase
VVAAVLVGGTEKLRGGEDYGVPLEPTLESAVLEHAPEVVIDLSDEPVLSPPDRLALASRALALGVPYEGPDFRFDPPDVDAVDVPTLAVIGTGKRVGKTASRATSPALRATRRVVVVAMGGGPAGARGRLVAPTVDALLGSRARAPRRLRPPRDGRRRRRDRRSAAAAAAAGWPARSPSRTSSRASRSRRARAELVVLDGSGAALPPVEPAAACSSSRPPSRRVAAGYLNAYRALISDSCS